MSSDIEQYVRVWSCKSKKNLRKNAKEKNQYLYFIYFPILARKEDKAKIYYFIFLVEKFFYFKFLLMLHQFCKEIETVEYDHENELK